MIEGAKHQRLVRMQKGEFGGDANKDKQEKKRSRKEACKQYRRNPPQTEELIHHCANTKEIRKQNSPPIINLSF